MTKKITQEEWDKRASAVGMKWLEPVERSNLNALAECTTCGHQVSILPSNLYKGQSCRQCRDRRQSMPQEEILKMAEDRKLRWLVVPSTAKEKQEVECLVCGEVWITFPSILKKRQSRCPVCQPPPNHKRSQEHWQQVAAQVNARFEEPVKGGNDRPLAVCLRCGAERRMRPSKPNLCKCSGRSSAKLSQAEWDQRAAAQNFEWLEPVPHANAKCLARCSKCDHELLVTPHQVSLGRSCPMCKLTERERVRESKALERLAKKAKTAEARAKVQAEKEARAEARAKARAEREAKAEARLKERAARKTEREARAAARREEAQAKQGLPATRIPQELWDERASKVGVRFVEPVKTASTKTKAECLFCSHQWMTIPNRIHQGHGCPACAKAEQGDKQRIDQSVWDDRAARVGLEWLEPVQAAQIKAKARCLKCQYEWNVLPVSVANLHGCPVCNHGAIKPDKPSLVYLVSRGEGIAKIGIMNIGTQRIRKHQRNGYSLDQTWDVPTGNHARQIEISVLEWWRNDLGLEPALRSEDGWTETVDLDACSREEISAQVDSLIKKICPEVLSDDFWTEERMAEFGY